MSFYDHPAFNGIDKNFLVQMDRTMKAAARSNDSSAILAAIMGIQTAAKQYNVVLTPDRQQALILHLRNNLPLAKRSQFDAFVSLIQSKM
ncbi:MAG: hypothetical protein ACRCWY_13120 [Cellulosilyticaceae bacterium]